MTDLRDITPKTNEIETKLAESAKPTARINQAPAKKEEDNTVWVKLVKGGSYGYKRAIYEQGKTYEVTKEIAEHLLEQFYTVGGNGQEAVDVYYFQEVPKKKK